jgi:hypothetical protein
MDQQWSKALKLDDDDVDGNDNKYTSVVVPRVVTGE